MGGLSRRTDLPCGGAGPDRVRALSSRDVASRLDSRGDCRRRDRGADDDHRHLQRAGHHQLRAVAQRSVDGDRYRRGTAGAGLAAAGNAGRRHRPDGPAGARTEHLEPDPQPRAAAHGGGTSDFAARRHAERLRVRRALGAREDDVRDPDAQAASDTARALRIDYIWIDRTERTAYPSGMAKFDAGADRFAPVFRNDEVSIYRVR